MVKLIACLIFLHHISLRVSVIIHPTGPTHRKFAIQCIEEITMHAYDFIKAKSSFYSQFLLTYIITKNLNAPGFEIQEEVLKMLHTQSIWSIEALQYGRQDFIAYSENCIPNAPINRRNFSNFFQPSNCVRKPVMQLKTHLYIMIVEDLNMFHKKLDHITNASSFNSEALYITYYTKATSNNYNVAQEVIFSQADQSISKIIVMIPADLTRFEIYIPDFKCEIDVICYSQLEIRMPFQCNKGKLTSNETNIFKEQESKNYFQCYVRVNALPLEPFIITQTSGIESDILHEVGQILNISFRVQTYPYATMYLGEKKEDGLWEGFLQPIYDSWELGIGNVWPEQELMEDFSYSVAYHWVQVVYIVPIAALIPRWRVLMVIFTVQMWGIILAVIFGFAIAFYVFKTKKEAKPFKTFEKCVDAAYQVLLGHPVSKQPSSNFTRVCFISLAFFAIIINSVYTTSLIFYLQNPIRKYQISSREDLVRYNLTVGGSPKYKEMFKSPTKMAKKILSSYQTVNESLDTYKYWLRKVAVGRNISTISVKLYVDYLLTRNNPLVIDRYGDPKVFIITKPLRSQPIGIIMRKGHLLRDKINVVIQKLIVEAGLINKIKQNYARSTLEISKDSLDDDDDDDDDRAGASAITTHHLEGAFAILALGQVCGFLAFIIEFGCYHIGKSSKKKKKENIY